MLNVHEDEKYSALSGFSHMIGGLSVNVANRLDPVLQGGCAEYMRFVQPANHKPDVQVQMRSTPERYKPEDGEVVFSSQYFKMQSVLDGFQLYRYPSEQQQVPSVTVQIDPEFSRFTYFFVLEV